MPIGGSGRNSASLNDGYLFDVLPGLVGKIATEPYRLSRLFRSLCGRYAFEARSAVA